MSLSVGFGRAAHGPHAAGALTSPRSVADTRDARPGATLDDLFPGRQPARPIPDTARPLLSLYRRVIVAADALIAALAMTLAVTLRFGDRTNNWYATLPLVLPLFWVGALALNRAYEYRFMGAGSEEFERVLRSGLALFTAIAVLSFSLSGNVSRSIVLFSVPLTVLGSLSARKLARFRLHRARAAGRGMQRTLVVGRGDAVVHLVDLLQHAPSQGLLPVGVCLPENGIHPVDIDGVPVVGSTEQIISSVEAIDAHVVAIVSHPEMSGHPLRQLSWALEERNVELLVSPGIVEVAGPRLSIRPVAGLSLLHLERPRAGAMAALVKAAFDRVMATLALVTLSPLLLALAAAVRVTSSGPALFRQTRVGVRGKEFSIYKFRSMVVDAEDKLVDLRDDEARDAGNDVLFKMRADPRITKVGGVLRRFSLDELPQLINVAKGDMSLVGPRPPLPAEVAVYEPDAVRRLHVRPGITGLWQVSGRSDLTWEESLRLDLRYVDNWSMSLDISILWKTIRAVFQGAGAY
jgi:exopolysaccharide biosynthesis polyprenyl glycosylphosphotransferase